MPYGRPADTDPDAWYKAAWKIDQACLANEAFQSVSRSALSAALKTVSARPPLLSVARLPLASPPLVTLKPPRGCYRCGDANHVVQDCSHHLDVRQLTTEQWEELIKDLLALKDTVPIEESCPPEEEDFA